MQLPRMKCPMTESRRHALLVRQVEAFLRQFAGDFQLASDHMEHPGPAQYGKNVLRSPQPAGEQQRALIEFADFRHAVALRGDQHGAKRCQQLQFLMVAPDTLREAAAKRQRAAEQSRCLGIGVPVARHRRRTHIVADRRLGHAGGFVVGRQLTADGLQRRRVKLLEREGNAPVQESPPHRAEFRVGDFAQAVVGEIVRCHTMRLALPFDDAALPQFVQSGRQAVIVPVGGLGEQIEREGLPDGAGQSGQFIGLGGELRQARGDDGVDARRCGDGAG